MTNATHAILLVEDNPADVEIARRALRESGGPVELIVVRDGQEAIDYLMRRAGRDGAPWRHPDLILLDLNLPRMSGHEVLEEIKQDPQWKRIPVVVLPPPTTRRTSTAPTTGTPTVT
jgi:two-component system, chemotaxis family, response regulator Rcp1